MRWWRLAGVTPPSQWRQPPLFVLPIVLLAAPFVAGVHPLPAVTVAAARLPRHRPVRGELVARRDTRAAAPHRRVACGAAVLPVVRPGPSGQLRPARAVPAHPRAGV